jgi:hypothetical protein
MKPLEICIIGAGTVGLSQAIRIKEALGNNANITIIADKFLDKTTSFVAAGLWEPY